MATAVPSSSPPPAADSSGAVPNPKSSESSAQDSGESMQRQQFGNGSSSAAGQQYHAQQQQQPMTVDPEDPLLIAQSLTYVTDDGSVTLSFASAPFSTSFKIRFIVLEAIFVFLLIAAVPIGAHGTIVSISLGNLFVVAWFWYNSVRSVDILNDGGLRFWIGNIEIDVPFEKIVNMRRVAGECSLIAPSLLPHRGYLTCPTDGVAIVTTVPSTPLWMWPRSAGKPERRLGPLSCPRLKVVFSPAGGGLNFIREVEAEMRGEGSGAANGGGGRVQPPSFVTGGSARPGGVSDLIDV